MLARYLSSSALRSSSASYNPASSTLLFKAAYSSMVSDLWRSDGLSGIKLTPLSSPQTVAQRKPIYIVSASRTPIGSFLGSLSSVSAVELGTQVVKHVMKKIDLDPKEVDEVFFGQVVQAGAGQSPARQVALGAGIPETTDATTINKVCASGMKTIMLAAQTMSLGDNECMVAGGMESMSKAP